MIRRTVVRLLLGMVTAAVLAASNGVVADERPFIIVQSTTSTENSGLLADILPKFTAKTGIEVRVVAVGTGQALKNARNGDGDVLLVHARPDEEQFVAEGWGVERKDVMYNDFVIVGPRVDPAGITKVETAPEAFARIAATKAPFVSRGDDSGTHKAEMALWRKAGVDAVAASGSWYREAGAGMGSTLNTATGMGAYALTDRATWASFRNKGDSRILFEGDPVLFNPYGVILVNPERHPRVKAKEGEAFIDWLTSREGQEAIAGFRVEGQQLFYPTARGGS